ncbi:MAG TPA: hypothetical protein VD833_06275 [Vicinamibacterales bacterium]|nr:hypothetical protein [Vicinamibacterales bacterium]
MPRLSDRTLGTVAAAALAGNLLLPHAAGAQSVSVTGTRVSMTPPAGFVEAAEFPGFHHPEAEASIMVTELPVPAAEMQRGMTRQALATKGITVLSSTRTDVGGDAALLLQVSQKAGGRDVLKWMLIGGDPTVTIMIVGGYPRAADPQLGAAMKRSVLSASWGASGPADPFAGLLYRIDPSARLKLAGRMSNMIMLTESGDSRLRSADEAFYSVGNSIGRMEIGDLAGFSERRARQLPQTAELRNVTGGPVIVDGLPGYELLADATHAKTGREIKLYQVIVPSEGGYYIMIGLVTRERGPEMVPEFRNVTNTFRRASR